MLTIITPTTSTMQTICGCADVSAVADVTAQLPIPPALEIAARAAYEEIRSPGTPRWEELNDYRRRLECRGFNAGLRALGFSITAAAPSQPVASIEPRLRARGQDAHRRYREHDWTESAAA